MIPRQEVPSSSPTTSVFFMDDAALEEAAPKKREDIHCLSQLCVVISNDDIKFSESQFLDQAFSMTRDVSDIVALMQAHRLISSNDPQRKSLVPLILKDERIKHVVHDVNDIAEIMQRDIKLGVELLSRSEILSLIRTKDDFQKVGGWRDLPVTMRLLSDNRIAELALDVKMLEDLIKSDVNRALKVLEEKNARNKIKTAKDFTRISKANYRVSEKLLDDERIRHIANSVLPVISFDAYIDTYQSNQTWSITHRVRTRPYLNALDLAYEPLLKKDKDISADHQDKLAITRYLTKYFLSTKSYVHHMMCGENGYYSTGIVDFNAHFKTYASKSETGKSLAAGFLRQIFHCWQMQRSQQDRRVNAIFRVLECGAGNGNLCQNILTMAKAMAAIYPEWNDFYRCIEYNIVEISPALMRRQIAQTMEFKDKVKIILGSALRLPSELKDESISAAISNELLDIFPPHKFVMDNNGKIKVTMIAPSISEKQLTDLPAGSRRRLKIESTFFKWAFCHILPAQNFRNDHLLLSQESFLTLHTQMQNAEFAFTEILVDSELIEEAFQFLRRNPQLFEVMQPGQVRYASVNLDRYFNSLQRVMVQNGKVLAVDYGTVDMAKGDACVRTYPGAKSDIFETPGKRDITYDVNFTTYAREAKKHGFDLDFFGIQSQMICNDSFFPDSVLSQADIKEFMSSPATFLVCSLRYRGSHLAVESKEASHFSGHSLPVTDEQLFQTQRARFCRFYRPREENSLTLAALPDRKISAVQSR